MFKEANYHPPRAIATFRSGSNPEHPRKGMVPKRCVAAPQAVGAAPRKAGRSAAFSKNIAEGAPPARPVKHRKGEIRAGKDGTRLSQKMQSGQHKVAKSAKDASALTSAVEI